MQLRTVNRTWCTSPTHPRDDGSRESEPARQVPVQPGRGLRYETTLEQLQRVATDIRRACDDIRVENETLRVRLIRFGAYSLDVEVFAT